MHSVVHKCWLNYVSVCVLRAVTVTVFVTQNGFWASIGWCLVLFIPVIILSVKLASLYRKSDSYPGPLVES